MRGKSGCMCLWNTNTQKCPARGWSKSSRKQGQGDEGMKSEVVIPAQMHREMHVIPSTRLERELAPSCLPQGKGTEELRAGEGRDGRETIRADGPC